MSFASASTRVVPFRRPNDLQEQLKAVLFAAARPVSATYLVNALGDTEARVISALLAPGDGGLIVSWDGTHAELVVNPHYESVVYAASQSDTARSLSLIEEYLSAQRQRGRRPGTITGYRQFMSRFASEIGRPIDEVTTRDVRRFLMREETDRHNTVVTITSKIHRLSSLYKWLVREEVIVKNPMERIDAPRIPKAEPRYLTHEEIERVRDVTKGLDRVLFEVLYSSGIRRAEAVALDWQDVNLETKSLFVRDGKGGKSRTVSLSTRAVMLLRKHKAKRPDEGPCVFRSQLRRRMSKESVNLRMRNLGEKAGLRERLTPHRLRHSMAKHLRDSGMPLDVIQALLGHEDMRTTQIYSRLPEGQIGQYYRAVFP